MARLKVGLLLACLLVSLVANVQLLSVARHYYALFLETQLDPLGLASFPAVAVDETSTQPRVVVFGDSRAAAWPVPAFWRDGHQVLNRGIGGQTSAQVLGRFGAHVAPWRPDIVLIQLGVNDLKAIGLFPDRRDEIVATCKAHLTELVRLSRAQGAVVWLSTIFPVGKLPLARRLVWSDDIAAAVVEVNAHIRALQTDGVLVFDAHRLLVDEDGLLQPSYARDFLHLNAAGYAHLNAALQSLAP